VLGFLELILKKISFLKASVEEEIGMKDYIQPYAKYLKKEIEKVKKSKMSEENKKLILSYHEHDFSNGLSLPGMLRKMIVLRIVAERYGVEFSKATRQDYERVISDLKRADLADATVWTYKKLLMVFHKWLNGGEQYPDCVKWFKFSNTRNSKLPEDLLTQDEVKRLIQASTIVRDKAFIACLWESGARIGEIGTIKLKNVSSDEYGCRVLVDGKTGMRKVRLINAAPFLLEWINKHPFNDDPNSPVWYNLKRYNGRLEYTGFCRILKTAASRAGLKKAVNPHNFRHSRATYLAQFLTGAQMKEYFGWVQDSKMAAQYIHLSGKQVDDALLRVYGLKKEEKMEDVLSPKKCPRCKHYNSPNNEYCEKCWLPLSQKAQIETIKTRDLSDNTSVVLMELLDLTKKMSEANPQKVQDALSFINKTLGPEEIE